MNIDMYIFDSRIRYSELDHKGKLSLDALLNYFQDSSTFHSEDLGIGPEYLAKKNRAWVLAYWQIIIKGCPGLGERVKIGTAPYGFRGVMGFRNFLLESENGERLVCANTIWTLMDTDKMVPVKVDEQFREKYILEEKIEMPYEERKILIPEDGACHKEALAVKGYHLDTNGHVNNVQYIKLAMEFLPKEFVLRQIRAEYKRQAREGDTMFPLVFKPDKKKVVVLLQAEDQKPYCIVEFVGSK